MCLYKKNQSLNALWGNLFIVRIIIGHTVINFVGKIHSFYQILFFLLFFTFPLPAPAGGLMFRGPFHLTAPPPQATTCCLTLEDGTDKLCRNVDKYNYTLHNIPEEWRSHSLLTLNLTVQMITTKPWIVKGSIMYCKKCDATLNNALCKRNVKFSIW